MSELKYKLRDTSLPARLSLAEVIRMYQGHGTREQCHGEFKTDLNLVRLPSGQFATNDCLIFLAGAAYNVLDLIGQLALLTQMLRCTIRRSVGA